jgi:uncharacterized phage-associated protein
MNNARREKSWKAYKSALEAVGLAEKSLRIAWRAWDKALDLRSPTRPGEPEEAAGYLDVAFKSKEIAKLKEHEAYKELKATVKAYKSEVETLDSMNLEGACDDLEKMLISKGVIKEGEVFKAPFGWQKMNNKDTTTDQYETRTYTAIAVANWFIKKYKRENATLDQVKLMLLVYFANGLHLALYNRPLVYEPIEAWRYGPVIRSLKEVFKYHGMEPITDLIEFTEKINSDDMLAQKLLREVFQTTKKITGVQLSNWSHKKYSPWHETLAGGVENLNKPINNNLMRVYFNRTIVPTSSCWSS